MTATLRTYPHDMTVPCDVMVDLETLGTGPGCAILSIGAVAFDPQSGAIGHHFHTLVSTAACRSLGLREEVDTIAWWNRRPSEARAILAQAAASDVTLELALEGLTAFLRSHGGKPRVRVWGNGADFDNAILADLYRRLSKSLPWEFWNNRCFRTFKALASDCEPAREGVHHNALDDARHQAVWACRIAARLRVSVSAREADAALTPGTTLRHRDGRTGTFVNVEEDGRYRVRSLMGPGFWIFHPADCSPGHWVPAPPKGSEAANG